MVMQFVAVRPPIHENKVGCFSLMNTHKSHLVVARLLGGQGQPLLSQLPGRRDQLGGQWRVVIDYAVDL